MKRLIAYIFALLLLVIIPIEGWSQNQRMQWEEVTQPIHIQSINDPRTSDGIKIYKLNQAIIIKTPQPLQVKIFTILGQLINQESLQQGTYQYKIDARGIYIVKFGSYTQKIAL